MERIVKQTANFRASRIATLASRAGVSADDVLSFVTVGWTKEWEREEWIETVSVGEGASCIRRFFENVCAACGERPRRIGWSICGTCDDLAKDIL